MKWISRAYDKDSLFYCFIFIHLILWTLIPALSSPNAPLDVIEGYAWGREWVIGTYKHPPMQAWWLEILAIIANRASYAHFLASQLAIVIAFWAVWRLGKRLTNERAALLGVLFLEGAVYYNFTSPEFNPNVLQLPFWALAGLSFYRAIKDNRYLDWCLLGVWAAGGLYTKYSMVLLLAVFALLMICHPEARKRLKSPGPYCAMILTLLLFAPHLKWLVEHGFLPVSYAESRSGAPAESFVTHFLNPVRFLGAQALSLLPLIILFLFVKKPPHSPGPSARAQSAVHQGSLGITFDDAFLHAVTFGPLAIILVYSLLTGVRPRDMWGSYLWNFVGLWLVTFAVPNLAPPALKRFTYGWIFIFALGLSALPASNALYPHIKRKGQRVNFPGQALSESITSVWHERFKTPLPFAIGDTWLAGNVAYYAKETSTCERPRVFIAADYRLNPQMKPKEIAEKGGVIIWSAANETEAQEMPAQLKTKFPTAEPQPPLTLTPQTSADINKVIIGWSILPPSPVPPYSRPPN